MKEFVITENEAEQRLDRFLLKYFNDTTRGNLYKLLRKKVFKINGKAITKPDYFLKIDDVLNIYLADETIASLQKAFKIPKPDQLGFEIVYEDEDILVVNKPKGLLTHPDKTEYRNTLSTMVQFYLRALCTSTFKPAPVHRLDKNTSGVVLFAKRYESLKAYNALMRDRKIEKYYLCVCEGKVPEKGEIRGYLTKNETINKVELSQSGEEESKFCHTKYSVLEYLKGYSLVEVELLTGRSHQIRVSMAYVGHPIVGDIKYGGHKHMGMTTQLLHAYKMTVGEKSFVAKSPEIDAFIASCS